MARRSSCSLPLDCSGLDLYVTAVGFGMTFGLVAIRIRLFLSFILGVSGALACKMALLPTPVTAGLLGFFLPFVGPVGGRGCVGWWSMGAMRAGCPRVPMRCPGVPGRCVGRFLVKVCPGYLGRVPVTARLLALLGLVLVPEEILRKGGPF